MYEETLNNKEKKIITEIEFNPRITTSQLSKQTKFGKELIKYRIKKLEDKEIIQHYSCIINSSKIGYLYYRIYLKLKAISKYKYNDIINYFKNNKRTAYLAELEGNYNLQLGFWAKTPKDFQKYQKDILSQLSEHIVSRDISLGSELTMLPMKKFFKNKHQGITMNSIEKKEKIDNIDKKILIELTKNSKQHYEQIGEKLGVNGKTIKYRIKQLEKKGILLGFITYIDFIKLGYYNTKIFLNLKNITKKNELKLYNNIKKNPNLIRINKPIGNYDLELELLVKNVSELHQNIKEITEENFDFIESYSSVSVIFEHIRRWLPLA